MRAIAIIAALVPLLTLPALAERAAVDKCRADADKAIASLESRIGLASADTQSAALQELHRHAMLQRDSCGMPAQGR